MSKTISFQIRSAKPRNPVAGAARLRQAGVHRKSNGAQRTAARRALRQELGHSPPHTL